MFKDQLCSSNKQKNGIIHHCSSVNPVELTVQAWVDQDGSQWDSQREDLVTCFALEGSDLTWPTYKVYGIDQPRLLRYLFYMRIYCLYCIKVYSVILHAIIHCSAYCNSLALTKFSTYVNFCTINWIAFLVQAYAFQKKEVMFRLIFVFMPIKACNWFTIPKKT